MMISVDDFSKSNRLFLPLLYDMVPNLADISEGVDASDCSACAVKYESVSIMGCMATITNCLLISHSGRTCKEIHV